MINFRFHLASLIAVFLALGVGIVMGSTVIDRAIVDGLRNRIDRVERDADTRKAENDQLRNQMSRLDSYISDTADFAVSDRLTGVSVAVIAVQGVDDNAVKATVALAQQAGAVAPAILWLQDKWSLVDEADRAKLASVLGVTQKKAAAMQADGLDALADRLAASDASRASHGGVLQQLVDAGFLRVEPVGDQGSSLDLGAYPGADARVLVVSGSDAQVAAKDFVLQATLGISAKLPTVVGEVFHARENGADRGTVIGAIRSDPKLKAKASTVDDLDLPEGQVTAVLALSDLGSGVVGHYGYGSGASRSVPEWTTP